MSDLKTVTHRFAKELSPKSLPIVYKIMSDSEMLAIDMVEISTAQ